MSEALIGDERRYFEYLIGYVYNDNSRISYLKLLRFLYDKNFVWTVHMDRNRAADGLSLRARFFDDDKIKAMSKPCSVLEMMIALADRMENHILGDPREGDRTGQWFWEMVTSMGLSSMNDSKFNEEYAESQVNKMIKREYNIHGEGGLFTVAKPDKDMKTTEIWYQMQWWVREHYL